ncbi:MAG: hypothetical protein M3N49_06945 [Candidatus Eremiobacteraeota bacterium]|nr:hypothetical protein [Candidatus Eremiobacteraeota bacterium]
MLLTFFYLSMAVLVALIGHKRGPGFVVSLLLAIVLTPFLALVMILVIGRNTPNTGSASGS